MHRYKDFRVWQLARELTRDIYSLSQSFPKEEAFGLTSQIRRAAVSVMLTIAEGAGRFTTRDFVNFLTMASGSANEVESAAIVAYDQGYITEDQLNMISQKVESLNNMLFRFQQKLRTQLNS